MMVVVLHIIMLSNFSKLDEDGEPIYDSRGKVLKGANYWAPEQFLRKRISVEMMREAARQKIEE